MRSDGTGSCESCGDLFDYMLIHNGFNDSAFAYCDQCGMTALFDAWSPRTPTDIDVGFYGPITIATEERAASCQCGGRFRGTASPRCPRCRELLSAEKATHYIERNAAGTAAGWRWQRRWAGLYAIVISDRITNNPWRDPD